MSDYDPSAAVAEFEALGGNDEYLTRYSGDDSDFLPLVRDYNWPEHQRELDPKRVAAWLRTALLAAHAAGKREAWGKAIEATDASAYRIDGMGGDGESLSLKISQVIGDPVIMVINQASVRDAARADGVELG